MGSWWKAIGCDIREQRRLKYGVLALVIGGLIVAGIVAGACDNGGQPKPTAERAKPTPTPTVAPISAVTPPPDTCPSPAEAAYFDEVNGGLRSIGAQVGMLSEYWAEAANNPILLLDDIWVMGRETDLMALTLHADRIIALEPPPSARQLDDMVATTMVMAQQVFQLQSDGITATDMDMFMEGSNLMDSVSDRARWIRAEMDAFCDR